MILLSLAAVLALGRPSPAAPAQVAAQEDDNAATRFFALPMVRDTRELAAAAEEHLRAERFTDGILTLQRILEDHANEVLPANRNVVQSRATYPGAAEWALERLFELPTAARAEYQARYEPRASDALARALVTGERATLASIPRRWPLAPSAVRAWWALGDLERESGHDETAELAWRRALALGERLGIQHGAAELRLAWLAERAVARAAARRTVPPPRGEAQPWTTPLDLTPFPLPNGSQFGRPNLLPAVEGDTVLVCSTLRLFALDAFTGDELWRAGPPSGWASMSSDNSLFQGISPELLLAPAAGAGIALAVLQEPFAENANEEWQGIEIMKAIPERRLHAFDLETGRELWNHAPTLDAKKKWDGGGTHAQRMMVAGSPVIAGARVLVPCYRMQGRIDYHASCYELATGELLWTTQLISGQRERNMFGRSTVEFCASPLVVVGDRVVAQTELGTIASLDLFSGRILWQTTYRQIDLPKTRSYQMPRRDPTWDIAAPVVVGDVVVATPADSREITAVRLSDGAKLWAYKEDDLRGLDHETDLARFELLLGADQDVVYLGGGKVSALHKPGLATSTPFTARWTESPQRQDFAPRGLVSPECVLVPSASERVAFDRRTGARIGPLSGGWNRGEVGNLVLADGALFSLSSSGISGYFDWQSQLERARSLAANAHGEAALAGAAKLFLRRGVLLLQNNDAEGAQAVLQESRALFERARNEHGAPDAGDELRCVRALAESLARLHREPAALAALDGARPLATGRAQLAALLFQMERVLRTRGGPERVAVLSELERTSGELALPDDVRAEAVRRWAPPPAVTREEATPLSVGLWVAIERADESERANAFAPALEDLHTALERAGTRLLAPGVPVAGVVRERITRILATPIGRAAYAPIEERAAARLAEARTSDDAGGLEAIAERFPHSRAAEESLALLIARAVEARDTAGVVRLVRTAVERGGLSPERETEFMLQLARSLGDAGNAPFERALVTALARRSPARVSGIAEHRGATLAALAAELGKDPVDGAPVPVRFDAKINNGVDQLANVGAFLGALRPPGPVPESAPLELHLYSTREREPRLLAYSSAKLGDPEWTHALEAGDLECVTAPGRVVLAQQGGLLCLDELGREAWRRPTEGQTRALAASGGVVVALSRSGSVLAVDLALGLELWERGLGEDEGWGGPLLGDGHAAFFAQGNKQAPRALVLDLFQGRTTADLRLAGYESRAALEECAWISDGRLVAPSFQPRPAHLSAFALDGGRRIWSIALGRDEELVAVAASEGRRYPVTFGPLQENGTTNGGVYELDENTGNLRLVVPLKPFERIMGLDSQRTMSLPAPYLFGYTQPDGERSMQVRAVTLPLGQNWTWTLPLGGQDLRDPRALPMPAVSEQYVAIAYQARQSAGAPVNEVVFLDKAAGKRVDSLILGKAFDRANRLELHGLGESLFVLGRGSAGSASLEILQPQR